LMAAKDSRPPGMLSDGMIPAVPKPSLRPMMMNRHPRAVPAGHTVTSVRRLGWDVLVLVCHATACVRGLGWDVLVLVCHCCRCYCCGSSSCCPISCSANKVTGINATFAYVLSKGFM
jgi:hypothetical protein